MAVQGLYAGGSTAAASPHETCGARSKAGRLRPACRRADRTGASAHEASKTCIAPHLDRSVASLSPVEHCILLMGAYELTEHARNSVSSVVSTRRSSWRKSFGGTDGHKFVNGVLDKLAVQLRPDEIARVRQAV